MNATLKIDTRSYTLDNGTANEPFDRDSDVVVLEGVQCSIIDEQMEKDEVIGRRLQQCRV